MWTINGDLAILLIQCFNIIRKWAGEEEENIVLYINILKKINI